jgi:hypothetical protein
MAEWPALLPAPLSSGMSVVMGENALNRTTQSGRRETVRYGSGAHDSIKATLRLFKGRDGIDMLAIFRLFYRSTLCNGVNWFSAPWITNDLGYSDHKGKIQGFPSITSESKRYADVSLRILIKKSSACPEDVTWPPEGW